MLPLYALDQSGHAGRANGAAAGSKIGLWRTPVPGIVDVKQIVRASRCRRSLPAVVGLHGPRGGVEIEQEAA
jgi:hypothetical protein